MFGSNATFARRLLRWYDRTKRDLPWRICAAGSAAPDPYHVLVSEAMLQQTQVASVVPYFHRFIARFPTLADLAGADEQEVLRLWQGLGYYSRARNLRKAAQTIITTHAGTLPRDVDRLLELPGVGRYTAGAVASIAFGQRSPILDGNVARVLCRIDKITADPRDKPTRDLLWHRAEAILPQRRLGDFNSALMELGAIVCTPRSPQCLLCPVRGHCEAFAAGIQEKIPKPRKAKTTPLLQRHVYCIRRGADWLIEQRPPTGRWAGMWQFITAEANGNGQSPQGLPASLLPLKKKARQIGELTHALTHRRYHFTVFICDAKTGDVNALDRPRAWVALEHLSRYPLPRPHLKIAEMLKAAGGFRAG